jgi:hypothetical protein
VITVHSEISFSGTWGKELLQLSFYGLRVSPTGRSKRTRWVVRFEPFGWPRGHPDSGPHPHVRLGRTLRPTRGHST